METEYDVVINRLLSKDIQQLLERGLITKDDIGMATLQLLKDYLTKSEFLDFNDILTDRLSGIVDDPIDRELDEEKGVIVVDEI